MKQIWRSEANGSIPEDGSVNYSYDLADRLTQASDSTGTYGFTYDNLGRLTGTSTQYAFLPGQTYTNSYTYDAASNRLSMTDPQSGITTYLYDTLNRLQSLTDPNSNTFGFSYDALSRRTSLTRPNGVNTSYNYDSLSHLLSILHQVNGATIDGATYTYDNAGNRLSKLNWLNGVTENYTYDPVYQLTQVGNASSTTESYSYDLVGNRVTSFAIPSYTTNSSNEMTANSSSNYTYDSNGNETGKTDSSGTTNFTWDYENRLASVELPNDGGTIQFRYDPFGKRVEKISPNATSIFAYDGHDLIEETSATGAVVARYERTQNIDEILAMLRGGTTSYYEQDGLKSVTSLSTAAGTLAQTYTFDSFGKLTASSGSLTNPLQYAGREFDPETGTYYMRARYFDPQIGRFLSEDPIGFKGGKNFYAYVGNNGVNQTDPDGTGVVDCAKALADLQASTARLAGRLAAAAAHGGPDPGHLKAINQAANQVKDDLAKVIKHCGCYVALAAEIALAIEAAEAVLAAAAAAAVAAA